MTTQLKRLERNYYKAANALVAYRREHGFEPGTKVIAQFRNEPPISGIIAPYGEAWGSVYHMMVPVLLETGRLQPWMMSDLTCAESSNPEHGSSHAGSVPAEGEP